MVGIYLEQIRFEESSSLKQSVNLSYPTQGSNSIFVNITDNPVNLSFSISGFDSDNGNDLDFYDYMNETDNTKNNFNESINTSYPLGILDNFERNATNDWTVSSDEASCKINFSNGQTDNFVGDFCSFIMGPGSRTITGTSTSFDFRN
ncbi:unnamed protein product, partial [marine sediment metagenome]